MLAARSARVPVRQNFSTRVATRQTLAKQANTTVRAPQSAVRPISQIARPLSVTKAVRRSYATEYVL